MQVFLFLPCVYIILADSILEVLDKIDSNSNCDSHLIRFSIDSNFQKNRFSSPRFQQCVCDFWATVGIAQ